MKTNEYNFTRPFFAKKNIQEIETMTARYEETLAKDLTFSCGSTTVRFYVMGLGDVMIAREFGHDFLQYCLKNGDPKWGHVVVCGGNTAMYVKVPQGDVNLLWWWSMGRRDDWFDYYLEHCDMEPDFVLCPSKPTLKKAQNLGLKTIYLPLAAGTMFRPLESVRTGIGYAGNRNHKDQAQELAITGAVAAHYELEWVDHIKTPVELNTWYNTKKIALGMTEPVQERWGMVNNRVFEVLASGTPFIIYTHHCLEEVLGIEYPYQSNSAEQTLDWVETISQDYSKYVSEFRHLSKYVQAKHSYYHRIEMLKDSL